MDAILTPAELSALANVTLITDASDMPNQTTPESKPNYSMWIKDQEERYHSATNLTASQILPPGVYHVEWCRDEIVATCQKNNTDKLYKFENGCLSQIINETEKFWNCSEVYKQNEIIHKRGLLLYGPPGSGKTSIINLLCTQIFEKNGLVFVADNHDDVVLTNRFIKNQFRLIEPDRPIIFIIEDIDQVIRQYGNDSYILNMLDGKETAEHCLYIVTSNDTSELSDALLRPSRIDTVYEVLNPSESERRQYFINRGMTENIDELVTNTEGFSFADLKETFVGVQIIGKPMQEVIDYIKSPLEKKDYLSETTQIQSIQ